MSLTTVRNKINTWLTPRWANLVNKQEAYKTTNGHYFQGLWTHTTDLEQTDALDGDTIPDNLASNPTDQPHDWRVLIGNIFDTLPLPARLRFDVYDGPQGKGWVACLQVKYKTDIYQRCKQVGPETDRTHNWRKL